MNDELSYGNHSANDESLNPKSGMGGRHFESTHQVIAGLLSVDTILYANPSVRTKPAEWVLGEDARSQAFYDRMFRQMRLRTLTTAGAA